MTHHTTQTHASERGFTLVELAIVMIIIGLLIGGILKGQELINNARVSSSVAQIKGIDAAINTFRDKYAGLPGDLVNATTRIPGCGAATICANPAATAGNSLIDGTTNAGTVPAAGTDAAAVFPQLAAAGMATTSNVAPAAGAYAFGTNFPTFNLGGAVMLANNPTGTTPTGLIAAVNQTGHWIGVGVTTTSMAAGNVIISASAAANIDRKLDDGAPNTGSVMATGSAGATDANCISAAGAYNEQLDGKSCGLLIKAIN